MDRRAFLRRSGLGVGVGIAASQLAWSRSRKRLKAPKVGLGDSKIEVRRTVCTHCSVGCAVDAVVENGVWVRQEPCSIPHQPGRPLRQGASALREHGHGEYRLRYPMKLVNGKYERISWDTALTEISAKMLELRKASGPDSVLHRLFQAQQRTGLPAAQVRELLGQQQLRPPGAHLPLHHRGGCGEHLGLRRHDQFVQRHAKQQGRSVHRLQRGRSPPREHVAHAARQGNRLQDDRGDTRFTRTAAKADEYVRIRSGTDIPFLFGLVYHIFKNGWEDKVHPRPCLRHGKGARRGHGQVDTRQGGRACGVREEQMFKVAKMLADSRPGTIVWCMGQTQHTIGNAMVRASCILQLALGNVGKAVAAPTSSAVTTTCKARRTLAPTLTRCPATTAWPKVRGSTSPTCGVWTSSGSKSGTPRPR